MPAPVQSIEGYHRYCPGEEQIRLSDAVCLGRRRTNFPKCKGCQFNDNERGQGPSAAPSADRQTLQAEEAARGRIASIFRAHDVRGACPDALNPDVAWRIGLAAAQFLRSELRGYDRSQREKSTVVVGRDMRRTSPELAAAMIEGLRTGGSPVIDIGLVDTPQLYFAVNQLTSCGGVQVTGGRHPADYNGFKICGRKGRAIGTETGLHKICKIAQNTARHSGPQATSLEPRDLGAAYKTFVRGFLKPPGGRLGGDRPFRIVVDASNGMAGRWVPLVFGDVDWLEIVPLNFEHNGHFLHEPDPRSEANLVQLTDRVVRSKAAMGVCFDGDADGLSIVDNDGHPVPADLLTALLAAFLLRADPGAAIVYDVASSRVVPEEIRRAGGVPRRERRGRPFFKKALTDGKAVFGGDSSGHYYFRDNADCESGLIAMAQTLNALTASDRSLSEIVTPLRRWVRSGERSIPCEAPDAAVSSLSEQHSDGIIDNLDGITVEHEDWSFNLRPSTTEPVLRLNVEAKDEKTLEGTLDKLLSDLGPWAG